MFCVLLNKPFGVTSRDCVNKIVKLYGIKKVGHAGTLDPGATGMLPIFVGQATKFISYIVAQQKQYTVTMQLGQKTDTADFLGKVIEHGLVPVVDAGLLAKILQDFCGLIQQEVPKVSAVRVKGKRLYEYARSGEDVELPTRSVEIKSIEVLSRTVDTITLSVVCGKGVYIRSLVEDIAAKLGTYAYVSKLHRDWVAPFDSSQMVCFEDLNLLQDPLENKFGCYSLSEIFASFERVNLSVSERQDLFYGKVLYKPGLAEIDLVALYCGDEFFGLGCVNDAMLKSIRLCGY